MVRRSHILVAMALTLLTCQHARAHFPWLVVAEDAKAALFFGESPGDRAYKLPESLAGAKVYCVDAQGAREDIPLKTTETEKLIGLVSAKPVDRAAHLRSEVTYGVYHGMLLKYYLAYHGAELPKELAASEPAVSDSQADDATPKSPALQAQLAKSADGLTVLVTWQGQPLPDAKVQLFADDGRETASAVTGTEGQVSFANAKLGSQQCFLLVGNTIKDDPGTYEEVPYTSSAHYLTVSFSKPGNS
jgi:hypothetical protein